MRHWYVAQVGVFTFLLFAVAQCCSADVLYYGGDPTYNSQIGYWNDSYDGHSNFYNERMYDNFTISPGTNWNVNGFLAQIADPNYPNGTELGEWEIRTGMSNGNMGTLVASGTSTAGSTTLVNNSFSLNNGLQGQTMTVSLSSPVVLDGGQTYWFALVPQDLSTPDHLFEGLSPGHANAVGSPLDNDSLYFDVNMPYNTEYPDDVSAAVLGTTSPAPEPTIMAGLLLGGMAMLSRRRRGKAD